MKPWLNWSTTVLSMALASLAKSRSLISITGTETMANASLSSLVGHVLDFDSSDCNLQPMWLDLSYKKACLNVVKLTFLIQETADQSAKSA